MKKRKRKKIIIFSSIAIILFILIASIEYTSHSQFCSACHYMKPFFQSWENSSHNQFECSICHYPPTGGIRSKLRKKIEGLVMVGRYWTKLYMKSKPWAEIRDESCLREGCHEKRLLEGEVQFKKVVFDHAVHFSDLKRGKRLQCTSCHSQIVQGEHITVTESSCFICHFKKSEHYPRIQECSHCHKKENLTGEKSFRFNHSMVFNNDFKCDKCHSNTIIGDGEVPQENCYKCHWEKDRLEKYDDTDLMHNTHIFLHKIECNLCHTEIQHKIVKDIETIADCQACHTDYHKAQKILYTGEGGKGITHPMPNIMLEKGLSCKGCHIFHEEVGGRIIRSETFISKAKACESCHGKGFSRILKEWEISTEKKLMSIRDIYHKAAQIIILTKNEKKEQAQALLEEAAFNIDIVERGKSVHNMTYSQKLLQASYNKIADSMRLIGSSYRPESFTAATKVVPTQCSNCHSGIEEINTQIYGLNFPHKNHLIEQKIQCDVCHSHIKKHGEFIASKKSCATCHHKDTVKECVTCHKIQREFYQGGYLNGQQIPKDIMFEAGVECTGCHISDDSQVYRSDKRKCLDCHEQGYSEIFEEWQKSSKNLIQRLKADLLLKKKFKLNATQRTQIQKIKNIIRKIESDGSYGIHNFSSVDEILTNSMKTLKSLNKLPSDEEKKFY